MPSDVSCPRCDYADLRREHAERYVACPGCGRLFLAVGPPDTWAVIGHLAP